MKKALVYIFFLGLLFLNSKAHAVASSLDAKVKDAIYKIHNENTVSHGISKKGSFSNKADLIIDFDDDCDDYDLDDYDTIIKDKQFVSNAFCFNSNQLTADYSSKTFCDKIYNHVNFSRLPRFNYISLRVLRL